MSRADQMDAFLRAHVKGDFKTHPLAGDASFRRYVRIAHANGTWMLMDAPPEKESVVPFAAVDRFLHSAGFSAPHIEAADEQNGFLLLEDLGDDSYTKLLAADIGKEETFYRAAIELLADWHSGGLDSRTLALPAYDRAVLMREVQLFSNWFLPQFMDGAALLEAQAAYVACWEQLLDTNPLATKYFVHRDFHADNLMWLPERESHARVGLLDFQDALYGDAAYDMVSLLEDARRDVPPALAQKMKAHYVALAGADTADFERAYALLAAQRNAKIIGIFTRLAARDGKQHYLKFLPRVWAHLINDVKHEALAPFAKWLDAHVPHEQRGAIEITKNASALGLAA